MQSTLDTDVVSAHSGVAEPYAALCGSRAFRELFAERVQRHFSPGGVFYVDATRSAALPPSLTGNVPGARYALAAAEVCGALVAESARWSDQHGGPRYATPDDWEKERDRLLREWFPRRSAIVLDQYRKVRLYGDVDRSDVGVQRQPKKNDLA